MPYLEHDDSSIYYEEYGSGFPVMLFAPGALLSAIDLWHKDPPSPWDPIRRARARFPAHHPGTAQRRSLSRANPRRRWLHSYAGDHLALMNHLHIERAHALGACIGVFFILRIYQDAPERLIASVLQQPIGPEDDSEPWTTRQVDISSRPSLPMPVPHGRFSRRPHGRSTGGPTASPAVSACW